MARRKKSNEQYLADLEAARPPPAAVPQLAVDERVEAFEHAVLSLSAEEASHSPDAQEYIRDARNTLDESKRALVKGLAEGLTEDELQEVCIALEIDERAPTLETVLAAIKVLDDERTVLREVRELFDLDNLSGDVEAAVRDARDEHNALEAEVGELGCGPKDTTRDLEELAQDIREIVAILEPKLGGFRDGEPAEIRDLRVAVDRISRRLPRLGGLR